MRLIAIALLAASALFCQDAKIIIVERKDTTELKKAYADFKAARERWEKAKTEVAKRYTTENGKVMDGWERTAFSVDFRALVPDPMTLRLSSNYGWINANTLTTQVNNASVPLSDLAVSSDGIASGLATKEKP